MRATKRILLARRSYYPINRQRKQCFTVQARGFVVAILTLKNYNRINYRPSVMEEDVTDIREVSAMTVQDITCFLKLAETLNYTKAAAALYISQPAVSRHISTLEQEVGGALFDRSVRRSVQLTEIGRIMYKGLKQCEEIYKQTMDTVRLHTEQALVLVNLMRGTTFPASYIPATTKFMAEHPSFRHYVNFIEYEDFEIVLDRGELLICSRELMPPGKMYESMKMTKRPVPYYIVASDQHKAFSDPDNVELGALAATTLFLPKMLPKHVRETMENTIQKLFGKPPAEILYLDSADSVSLFLRSHECFTVCTGWHRDVSLAENRSIPLPLFTEFYALWHPEKLNAPLVRDYLQALRDSEQENA